jgi:hypothetical protein
MCELPTCEESDASEFGVSGVISLDEDTTFL